MKDLTNKFAVITGATSGIGTAIAEKFAKAGAHVAIIGTNQERAEAIVNSLKKQYPQQEFIYELLDVSNFSDVQSTTENILKIFERIDILVNNAGITRDQLMLRMSEEDWDRVLEVNLKSVFNTCKAVLRPMLKAKCGGVILNITSVVGMMGNAGQSNYAASKAGMIGFTKSLAKEVAGKQIRVNCIAPGYIETKMTGSLPDKVKEGIIGIIPMKQIGKPEDVANAALFLASDAASYITGQTLPVDGGMI